MATIASLGEDVPLEAQAAWPFVDLGLKTTFSTEHSELLSSPYTSYSQYLTFFDFMAAEGPRWTRLFRDAPRGLFWMDDLERSLRDDRSALGVPAYLVPAIGAFGATGDKLKGEDMSAAPDPASG